MITNNILNDLHGVFVAMRNYGNQFTPESVLALIDGLHPDRKMENENIVRQILRSYQLSSIPPLHFITTDNEYTFSVSFHSKELYIIIADILFTISILIREGRQEQLYDFADSIHNFPIAIHTQNIKSPHKLASKLLKPYRKKWHCELFQHKSESN